MIVVVDYGRGNLYSLSQALSHIRVQHVISDKAGDVSGASSIILPGVGAFGDAMKALTDRRLVEPIKGAITDGIPFLGICLGMQILADTSDEFGFRKGLGVISGSVRALPPPSNDVGTRIPNIGWRRLVWKSEDPIIHGLKRGAMFYFVHSYGFFSTEEAVVATSKINGCNFPAIVRRRNVVGFQFHPEKSGTWGLKILQNFFLGAAEFTGTSLGK